MHDVLEGVLQYEAKLVLAHLIRHCRHIRLSHLNNTIESIELGYMEVSSRHSPTVHNMEDKHLKQNGMCIMLHVRTHVLMCTLIFVSCRMQKYTTCNLLLLY